MVLLLLAPASFGVEGMKRGTIVVTAVQGAVLFTTPADAEPKPLKKGDVLRQGATILTGKGAVADLAFSNGSVMQVAEGSKFVIQEFLQTPWPVDEASFDKLEAEPTTSETAAYLDFGDVIADVKKLNKGSSLEVTTPLGTAGVRGTAFRVAARRGPDGRPQLAQLSVARGQVDFGSPGGQQVAVNGGFSSTIGPSGPQGDAPGAPAASPTSVDEGIVRTAESLRSAVDAGVAEAMNTSPVIPISAEQQQALEQAAMQGENALVETVSRLATESPDQAVGIAEAATEQLPAAAPKIATAAATVSPNETVRIAAVVSSVIPASAPEVAAAVSAVNPNAAPRVAAAIAGIVPTLTPQIAASVVSSVPQSTLAVAQALAATQPQQADRIADVISQTGGGLDADAVKNAVQQGVQQSTGSGGGTGGQGAPPASSEASRNPIVPPVNPTPTPSPSPTPAPTSTPTPAPTPTPTPNPSSL